MTHNDSANADTPPASTTAFRWQLGQIVLVVTLVGFAALVLILGVTIFLLAFAGILVGVFLDGLTRLVQRRAQLHRQVCLLLVLAALLVLFGGMGLWLGPRIAEEGNVLVREAPRVGRRVRSQLAEYQWGRQLLRQIPKTDNQYLDGREAWRQVSVALGMTATTVSYLIVVLFMGIYLAWNPNVYVKGAVHLVPSEHRAKADSLFEHLSGALRRWILGKLASMALVGVLTVIGLLILGVPLPFTLGLLAALLAFVPNFGPIAAIIPAILFAFPQGIEQVAWVVALYLGVQAFESYLITPVIQREMTRVPPAVILFMQALMAVLFGLLGVLLAVPLAAVGVVVLEDLYLKPRRAAQSESELASASSSAK